MAQSLWGANVQTNASCEVRLLRDGSVEVLSSVQDIGTGIGTVLAQVVAEELGPAAGRHHRPDRRHRFPGRAALVRQPDHGLDHAAGAQRRLAGLADAVPRGRRRILGAAAEDLVARGGRIVVRERSVARHELARSGGDAAHRADQRRGQSRSDDYGGFRRHDGRRGLAQNDLGGVQFAEVAVDTETGIVRVERVVAVQDCGRPMNPRQIESQVQGGVLMGLSYALFEERIIDRHTGHMLNADLEHYKIAGVARDAGDRSDAAGELSGPERDRRLRHRRAGEHRDRARHRQRRLQRDRRAAARSLPMTPAAVLAALGRIPRRS